MARIVIEYTSAAQGGGVGRAIRDLTAALLRQISPHEYTLWVAGQKPAISALPSAKIVHTPINPLWLIRLWHRARIPMPVEWLSGTCDLFFATDFALPPTHTKNTALFIHDLSYIRVPNSAAPSLKAYLDDVVPRSLKRATHVIVNSQATRTDVAEIYGVDPSKVTPVTFGVDPVFRPSDHPRSRLTERFPVLQRPYILSLGTVQPRKNYVRLIQAIRQIRASGLEVDLAIAGGKGWLDSDILAAAGASDIAAHIHLLGYVSDDDLPMLYTHAACFTMPSLYEGFGLPVLEAMACGTPVVTSNISSLPEAAGNAGLLCDPYSADSIADALTHLLTDTVLRETCIQRGFSHAARHTWEAGALTLLGVFNDLLR